MKSDLLVQNLYDTALLAPIYKNTELNSLLIVSGYASSAMASRHLVDFARKHKFPKIDLIYGMAKEDGVMKSAHDGFQKLVTTWPQQNFACSYLMQGEAVHSKIYIWCKGTTPVLAFTGSANYTEAALIRSQRREVLTETNPRRALDYFKALKADSVDCLDSSVASLLRITMRSGKAEFKDAAGINFNKPAFEIVQDTKSQFFGLEKATVSLLDNKGNVPLKSGLNWGIRPAVKSDPEKMRNPNQSYLSLRGTLPKSNFFPPRKYHFTVLTDDDQIIQCVRAQDGDKAIHTPKEAPGGNSLLGSYFRTRLGLPLGSFVTKNDLLKYGRTDVDFYKIDDENFYMDFAAPKRNFVY